MGLFDWLKRKPKTAGRYAPTQTGYSPIFSDFGDSIYASDIIVQAIRCKATEFKKLEPHHIRDTGGKEEVVTTSSVAKILQRPNEYMTASDFFEKITVLLELNKNVFIYPTYYKNKYGEKVYTGIYPLKASTAEYMIDTNDRLYLRLRFASGYQVELPAEDVIHWRKDYGVNDYFGGNMLGTNDNVGLLKMLQEYDKITQSIAIGLNCSLQINGLIKAGGAMDQDRLTKVVEDFNRRLANNESGMVGVDSKAEYVPIQRDVKFVDKDTMEFFYKAILRNTGVPLAVFDGDFTKATKEAFYEHALEADIKSLGEAMSKVLFTDREAAFGNKVTLYPNQIVFMSMENKLAFAQIAVPSGSLKKDEVRRLFGYPPLPDGQGEVIAQGYNALLDENNNNKLQSGNAAPEATKTPDKQKEKNDTGGEENGKGKAEV